MRHLLGIEELDADKALALLERAEHHGRAARAGEPPPGSLRGKTVVQLFFEASTRTRASFEAAAKRLGADVINLSPSTSSVTKGETLLDTARNLEAMRPHALVLRHPTSGAPHFLARHLRTSILNAGDGAHEHPTQALLDAYTIRQRLGRIAGVRVAICGDISHSRVARSNALLLGKLGAEVRVAGPRTLLPPRFGEAFGVQVFDRLEPALEGADVVMALRVQRERLVGSLLPSTRDYSRSFGITRARMKLARPGAVVMHPGPINRGVELEGALADAPESLVLEQVEAGVAVRAAVLEALESLALPDARTW
jgi:aspartate carbamoyltransferase catalytic subunit